MVSAVVVRLLAAFQSLVGAMRTGLDTSATVRDVPVSIPRRGNEDSFGSVHVAKRGPCFNPS